MTGDRPRELWRRADRLEAALAGHQAPLVPDASALLVQVFDAGSIPTSLPAVFAAHPVPRVTGVEKEAGSYSAAPATGTTVYVTVFGSHAPAAGDLLVARRAGRRWVAWRGSPGTPTASVPGCPCPTMPVLLHMAVDHPETNNHIFQPATLQFYQPPPPEFAPLALGPRAYLSTASFRDDDSGDEFWYYLSCSQGFYFLTRVYLHSVFGSPFQDIIRYKWLVGLPGNTCNPFALGNGQIFAGGDTSCHVTITA